MFASVELNNNIFYFNHTNLFTAKTYISGHRRYKVKSLADLADTVSLNTLFLKCC